MLTRAQHPQHKENNKKRKTCRGGGL